MNHLLVLAMTMSMIQAAYQMVEHQLHLIGLVNQLLELVIQQLDHHYTDLNQQRTDHQH